MTNEIEQGLHEKLCAVILGEASDEVRAEVERALEQSADLREERERLEKTIGMVRATMAGSESLPPSAAEEILANARRPRREPWFARPSFRIAAGLATVAIAGVLAFRAMRSHRSPANEEVAMIPRTVNERGRALEAKIKTEADVLANAQSKSPASAPADSTGSAAPRAGAAEHRRLGLLGQTDSHRKQQAPGLDGCAERWQRRRPAPGRAGV
jgi:hypothetical protein